MIGQKWTEGLKKGNSGVEFEVLGIAWMKVGSADMLVGFYLPVEDDAIDEMRGIMLL